MMDLRTKIIGLAAEKSLIVCEADAGYDARIAFHVNVADKAESPDKAFLFFYRTYYPIFAACTRGELPSPQEAFELPADKLDEWYRAVWELNPDILGDYQAEAKKETVTFRDGSKIVVYETLDLPSFMMKTVRLESEALARTDTPADETNFRTVFYPRIAGCVNGSVIPNADEAAGYPRTEIAKWIDSALRLNPKLFGFIVDEAEKIAKANKQEDDVKKKGKRRLHRKPAESVVEEGDQGATRQIRDRSGDGQ